MPQPPQPPQPHPHDSTLRTPRSHRSRESDDGNGGGDGDDSGSGSEGGRFGAPVVAEALAGRLLQQGAQDQPHGGAGGGSSGQGSAKEEPPVNGGNEGEEEGVYDSSNSLAAEVRAALQAEGSITMQEAPADPSAGCGEVGGQRSRRASLPNLPPLTIAAMDDLASAGASAAGDSCGATPKRPNSPPRRPRETTFPHLLPPPSAPASMALPAALSALRFALLHQSVAAAPGAGGSGGGGSGAYGDGPLWAAAAATELLGLRRCYRRLDILSYLAQWQQYDFVRAEGREDELAAAEEALRRDEDAATDEDGAATKAVAAARAARTAAAADSAAAASMVAADTHAQQVWELATLAIGAPAAPLAAGAPAGGGAVSFAALGADAPLHCGQDHDALAQLPACSAPMLFSTVPSRFSSSAHDAERRRAVALKRPAAAAAKAGLVDAARAARAVARFLEVAPPSAYSQSVREARSEVVSQIGSVSVAAASWGGGASGGCVG